MLAELRETYREARDYLHQPDPPFPLLNPFTGEMEIIPLREWIEFAEKLVAAGMMEGISPKGLYLRWQRYRTAGTDVSNVSDETPVEITPELCCMCLRGQPLATPHVTVPGGLSDASASVV